MFDYQRACHSTQQTKEQVQPDAFEISIQSRRPAFRFFPFAFAFDLFGSSGILNLVDANVSVPNKG